MIDWLKTKFSTAISTLFVLFIVFNTIGTGILGYTFYGYLGCFVGLILGLLFGILVGIIAFGFCATIINISNTCNQILKYISNDTESIPSEKNECQDEWTCPNCGIKNDKNLNSCSSCNISKKELFDKIEFTLVTEKDKKTGFYTCAKCGRKNPFGNPKCIDCQTPKKEE